MHLGNEFDRQTGRKSSESGYILITLMMMCSMIVIMLAVVLPQMSQQIRRDREMELIHRGVQYSRAIRRFYKKNGRYPVRLEELENSNNIRYLRNRYKDPATGKDFKLLHFGEVQVGQVAGIAGGVAPGANALGAVPGPSSDSTDGQSAFGGLGRVNTGASLNPRGALSNQSSDSPSPASSDNSGSSSSSFGTSSNSSSSFGTSSNSSSFGTGNSSSSPFANSANAGGPGSQNPSGFGGQVFGGGPIVGVASTSKKQSIREFNKKNHYNDWQFIYDPSSDRGGLLSTPAQPALQGVPAQQNQQPAGVPVLTPGGQQGQQGGFGQQGPGMTPPPSMTPQMPPDQQQAPQ